MTHRRCRRRGRARRSAHCRVDHTARGKVTRQHILAAAAAAAAALVAAVAAAWLLALGAPSAPPQRVLPGLPAVQHPPP
eukprot:COSAG01_NODE_62740_length_283_cov_0.804348_1_plen_78_part_10